MLDEPCVTIQADDVAAVEPVAVVVARLGELNADLQRVGDTRAKGEAAFRRRHLLAPGRAPSTTGQVY